MMWQVAREKGQCRFEQQLHVAQHFSTWEPLSMGLHFFKYQWTIPKRSIMSRCWGQQSGNHRPHTATKLLLLMCLYGTGLMPEWTFKLSGFLTTLWEALARFPTAPQDLAKAYQRVRVLKLSALLEGKDHLAHWLQKVRLFMCFYVYAPTPEHNLCAKGVPQFGWCYKESPSLGCHSSQSWGR